MAANLSVNYYPPKKGSSGSAIERFLARHRVQHELIPPEEAKRTGIQRITDLPALEVNGRIFVNPNDHALRKILEIS